MLPEDLALAIMAFLDGGLGSADPGAASGILLLYFVASAAPESRGIEQVLEQELYNLGYGIMAAAVPPEQELWTDAERGGISSFGFPMYSPLPLGTMVSEATAGVLLFPLWPLCFSVCRGHG